jgi:DNA-binding MarR family transcriptional regulator
MSVSQHTQRPIAPLPDEIDSPRAKLVYLYLSVDDGGSLSELQEHLGLPKITLLSVLAALSSAGYVDRKNGRYVTE